MSNAAQITHESETQRQYIRLQLPALADINNNRYSVKDLSSGGMAIRDTGKNFKKGDIIDLILLLPFADFTLDIDLKAEIQHIDKKDNTAGCRFVDLNANQISILNHVIKSFMAGDVVGANDIINVVSRENFVNVRKHANNQDLSAGEKIKKYGTYALVALATLFLSFFIVNNIIEKMLIVKTPYGQVQAASIQVLNSQSGTFQSAVTTGVKIIKKDQVIATIIGNTVNEDGTAVRVEIKSPCDCFIQDQTIIEGQFAPEGATLFKLLPENATIMVEAKVPTEEIHRLNIGTEAVVSITGTQESFKGTILDIRNDAQIAAFGEQPVSIVQIQTEKKLSGDLINRPTFVEFRL